MTESLYLGVDVAKAHVDFAARAAGSTNSGGGGSFVLV